MHCAPVLLPSYLAQGREAARGIVAWPSRWEGEVGKGALHCVPNSSAQEEMSSTCH